MHITKLSMEQAAIDLHNNKEIVLIDIRTKEEYEEGHIPGSLHIPLQRLESMIEEIVPNFDQVIYYYCRSGVRTVTAGILLEYMGYTKLYDIGGINDWQGEVIKK